MKSFSYFASSDRLISGFSFPLALQNDVWSPLPLMRGARFLPELNEKDLEEKFAKLKPRMGENEAFVEASRCLFCHDAPCIKACPTAIDIPMFIRQIMSRNVRGAAKTIFTQNILGKSCGDVCPTEVLCEGSCVYLKENKKPIEIGRLQAFASVKAIENGDRFFKKGNRSGKRVAVIGSGPAGLACAHELIFLGHEAVVFEASSFAGGLNRYGVAPYKYSNRESDEEVAYVEGIGFEIRKNAEITAEKFKELDREYDAVFLGIGLGKSRFLGLPGEDKENVFGAAEFIHNLREKNQKIRSGERVVVIGGGNTAMDAAIESAKLGGKVTLLYRRSRKDLGAYWFEVELAKKEGVEFLFEVSPVALMGDRSVTGIRSVRNGEECCSIEGSEFVIDCDTVILATGQEKRLEFLKRIPRLELDHGKIKVDENFQTGNAKYFAGGDCVNGGKEVVHAVAQGRDAARGMDRFLRRMEKE